MKKLFQSFLILSLIFIWNACSFKKLGVKMTAQSLYDSQASMDTEQDVELAQDASLVFLKLLDGLYIQSPKDRLVLLLLTRAYGGYAYGFTENRMLKAMGKNQAEFDKAEARAKLFYGRAKKYGVELLSLNPKFAKAKEGRLEDFEAALKSFKKDRVEDLFWAGFAWGNYLNFNKDSIEAVADVPLVEAVMRRVLELDENYYYGGAHLFFGVYYGSRPPALGGNPQKSKEHFEKARQISQGKNLMVPVAMAQFYAVQTQNSALYDQLLREVLASDASILPEQRLLNELAKIRAKLLLEKKSVFFTN